jgi:uncharacterized protein (TIGR03382 family)
MKIWNWIAPLVRFSAAAAVALASHVASAGPVTLTLQGHVSGYEFIDLSGVGIANGSAVSLSLTFNETWSDGTYSFADPIGPVSGSMTVGSHSFTFDDANPFSYSYDGNTGAVNWVQPQFLGTGPTLGGGDFFGLFAAFTPGMALQGPMSLGYGFTTSYPDGFTITNYGYAVITADSYTITPGDANPVPTPATLPLAALALLAAGFARRRA